MNYTFLSIFFLISSTVVAQVNFSATVKTDGSKEPITAAYVYWQDDNSNVEYTDLKGAFSIPLSDKHDTLVISYLGYTTLKLHKSSLVNGTTFFMKQGVITGEGVQIVEKNNSKEVLSLEPIQVENITTKELRKAACCNLSESFETNPSVDVNFADAVTGAKRIRLLGLDGVYSLITLENIPEIRGLASSYGLTSIPGPWIHSIQLAKGVGSVINGYESITGQINVQLQNPMMAPKFHFNGYINNLGRAETSMYASFKVSENLSTLLMLHGNSFQQDVDANGDGFIDVPKLNHLSGSNRWMFYNDKIESQFGVEFFTEDRVSGQLGFDPKAPINSSQPWGLDVSQDQFKAYAKLGVLPKDERPDRSIGFINKFSYYKQEGAYGLKDYSGENTYWYSNVIFQDKFINRAHLMKLGGSFFVDDYDEVLTDNFNGGDPMLRERTEIAGGAFAEYTYSPNERFTFISGGRIDYNNLFGWIATPRLHVRYKLKRNLTWRLASGSGQRTPNVFVDNARALVNQRKLVLSNQISQEKAWNLGTSLVWNFIFQDRDASITWDVYHTEFSNMLVMDMDFNHRYMVFYNMSGRSYASVAQMEVNYELLRGLDARVSYKWQDVKTTFIRQGLTSVPFVATGKFLANMGYTTLNGKWNFDATALHLQPGRVSNHIHSDDFQEPQPFWRVNAQVTYRHKAFEVYLGGENLTGFTQENPIISANDPFGADFDASNVWAPIYGRMAYLGVRYTLF